MTKDETIAAMAEAIDAVIEGFGVGTEAQADAAYRAIEGKVMPWMEHVEVWGEHGNEVGVYWPDNGDRLGDGIDIDLYRMRSDDE